jgi:L-alanine-DL-glutamate epimerase-like enolase superfamily enzyme
MQISSVALHRVAIGFRSAFRHARSERSGTEAVIVALGARSGQVGYGEILPRDYVTGETVQLVLGKTAPRLAWQILGARFHGRDEVVAFLRATLERAGRDLACFAGFELALLDLAGQVFDFPLGAVLGARAGVELPAGVVIGLETETRKLPRYCAALRLSGRQHVKVKVGVDDDLERLSIVSSVFGHAPLRLDANGAWGSAGDAIRALRGMIDREIPVASVEQPIAAGDLAGLRRIREETGIPVMLDESVCTLQDADRVIEAGAADVFNIRLGKCGGVLGSLRLVERAHRAGISCHLGALVGQTGILCRASEVFARFVPGFGCLEGKGQNEFLLEADLLDQPADARQADPLAPGLGVRVSDARLDRYRMGEPLRFDCTEKEQLREH